MANFKYTKMASYLDDVNEIMEGLYLGNLIIANNKEILKFEGEKLDFFES